MNVNILFPELMDFTKPCLTCSHYAKHMSRYEVVGVIEHHLKETGKQLVYELGQKFCVKQNEFVYFNWNCNNYNKSFGVRGNKTYVKIL